MVNFGEFLKTWSLRSNSVTRQVSFNRTKIGGKCQKFKNSNATFWVTFKQCESKNIWSPYFSPFFPLWHCSFSTMQKIKYARRVFEAVQSWMQMPPYHSLGLLRQHYWSWHCNPVRKKKRKFFILPPFLPLGFSKMLMMMVVKTENFVWLRMRKTSSLCVVYALCLRCSSL